MKTTHPKGLTILFFSELWERFSFYGMRALLVLYMTKQMLYGDKAAYAVYGAYGALVYAMPVIGGMMADRLLGNRRAVFLGGILMAIGHFLMAIQVEWVFYCALGFLCVGNGFFKPNISTMVGKLYAPGDARRDGGFTIFYMGVNLGAFLSPLICGLIGEKFGWHYGFGLAGVGMVLGLFVFARGQKILGDVGLEPSTAKLKAKSALGISNQSLTALCCVAVVPLLAAGLSHSAYLGGVLYFVGAAVMIWMLFTAFTADKVARERMLVLAVLMFFHMAFWAFFEQAGSSMILFAERNVDRSIFGWIMPSSISQSFNPAFIILLAPFFSRLWIGLQAKGRQPSIPMKFVLAIVQVGLGFLAMVIGSKFAGDSGYAGLIWLVLAYFLHTTGELCISPVGLSAVTKLSPAKVVSTVMGAWFLTVSFGHHLAGGIAALTGVRDTSDSATNLSTVQSLGVYSEVFMGIFFVSVGAAIFLLMITPVLKRWSHGVD